MVFQVICIFLDEVVFFVIITDLLELVTHSGNKSLKFFSLYVFCSFTLSTMSLLNSSSFSLSPNHCYFHHREFYCFKNYLYLPQVYEDVLFFSKSYSILYFTFIAIVILIFIFNDMKIQNSFINSSLYIQ